MTPELKIRTSRRESSANQARRVTTPGDRYNTMRLHSAIGFVTPADMLAGRQAEIHAVRDRKLEQARQERQKRRNSVL